jgi:tetratricopeptide (TPR) repeat protein
MKLSSSIFQRLLCFSLCSQTNAEMHYQKALNIRRKVLGENHVSVASVLHKLASALISKGDYDDALAILQQSQGLYPFWFATVGCI